MEITKRDPDSLEVITNGESDNFVFGITLYNQEAIGHQNLLEDLAQESSEQLHQDDYLAFVVQPNDRNRFYYEFLSTIQLMPPQVFRRFEEMRRHRHFRLDSGETYLFASALFHYITESNGRRDSLVQTARWQPLWTQFRPRPNKTVLEMVVGPYAGGLIGFKGKGSQLLAHKLPEALGLSSRSFWLRIWRNEADRLTTRYHTS